jgi:hypothetical protein
MSKSRVLLILAEIIAIGIVHVVYLYRSTSKLPKGSQVDRIHGRPVLSFTFLQRGAMAKPSNLKVQTMGNPTTDPRRSM